MGVNISSLFSLTPNQTKAPRRLVLAMLHALIYTLLVMLPLCFFPDLEKYRGLGPRNTEG